MAVAGRPSPNALLALSLAGFVLGGVLHATRGRARADAEETARLVLTSPGPEVLALATAEHALAAADLVFLRIVQSVGHAGGSNHLLFARLEREGHLAADLDPRYLSAYDLVATLLSAYGSLADASDAVLEKGRKALPQYWRFPFMMGWNDYFIRGRAEDAAQHWRDAAMLPEAPFYLGSLAGRALRQASDDIPGTIAFLRAMLESVADERQREIILERIRILESEPILEAYDRACERWREAQGEPPGSAQALYMAGAVEDPPVDRLGSPLRLDTSGARCVTRSEMIPVREWEAKERVGRFRASPAMNPWGREAPVSSP